MARTHHDDKILVKQHARDKARRCAVDRGDRDIHCSGLEIDQR